MRGYEPKKGGRILHYSGMKGSSRSVAVLDRNNLLLVLSSAGLALHAWDIIAPSKLFELRFEHIDAFPLSLSVCAFGVQIATTEGVLRAGSLAYDSDRNVFRWTLAAVARVDQTTLSGVSFMRLNESATTILMGSSHGHVFVCQT